MNPLKKSDRFGVLAIGLTISFGWAFHTAPQAHAQTARFEAGEDVKVNTFFGWENGRVVERRGNSWVVAWGLAEGNYNHKDIFTRHNIRKPCEEHAIDYLRVWERNDKKFKIEAALKGISADGLEVTLVKVDLNEIKVKTRKLSDKDQSHIKKVKDFFDKEAKKGNVPALLAELPPLLEFDESNFSTPDTLVGEFGSPQKLGPIPSFLQTFSQAGFSFNALRPRQEYVATIPVGGPDQLVLLTTKERKVFDGPVFQSQGYWISLKNKKLIGTFPVSPLSYPIDYDPRNKLLLTARDHWDIQQLNDERDFGSGINQSEIVLWQLPPGGNSPVPKFRWESSLYSTGDGPGFLKVINDKIVLAQIKFGEYRAWNLATRTEAYSFKTIKSVELTEDRKFLIYPEGNRVLVVNAEDGQLLFQLVSDEVVIGANVNSSGKKIAAMTNRSIKVWDLEKSEEPVTFPAPFVGHPYTSRLDWIDDDQILLNGLRRKVLYRLSVRQPIWSYEVQTSDIMFNEALSATVNGKFVYFAEDQNGSMANALNSFHGGVSRLVVGVVDFPGPRVMEISEEASAEDADATLVLKPGVHVDIALKSVDDPDHVRELLLEKIKEAGWVYHEGSSIKVVAEMGVMESRNVEYRQMGIGLGGQKQTTSVTFAPHYAFVVVTDGARILWKLGTSTSPPFHLASKSEDLQAEINKMQVPQGDFFRRFKFDPRVLDPEYANGFGVSTIGLEGIVVTSVSPPGRADDPWKEAEAMESAYKKEMEERQKKLNENQSGDPPVRSDK